MNYLEIRDATSEDVEQILAIENEAFHQPWKKEDILFEIEESPYTQFLVAEQNKRIIGFTIYFVTFDTASIAQIAVQKEFRRQHIGDALMDELIKDTFAKKVSFITLEVRESNIPAIAFYKKWKYFFVLKKERYYPDGENALYMMRKVLG